MNIVQVRQFLELEERLLYTVDALEEPNIAVRALYDIYLIQSMPYIESLSYVLSSNNT